MLTQHPGYFPPQQDNPPPDDRYKSAATSCPPPPWPLPCSLASWCELQGGINARDNELVFLLHFHACDICTVRFVFAELLTAAEFRGRPVLLRQTGAERGRQCRAVNDFTILRECPSLLKVFIYRQIYISVRQKQSKTFMFCFCLYSSIF